jgi:WD40 repeat protein
VIQLSDGRVCSGSSDKTIRIWHTATDASKSDLTGHTDSVYSLIQLSNGRLCSGSGDKTIRICNTASGACESVLTGHTVGVIRVIQLPDGRVCRCSFVSGALLLANARESTVGLHKYLLGIGVR